MFLQENYKRQQNKTKIRKPIKIQQKNAKQAMSNIAIKDWLLLMSYNKNTV